MNTNWFDVLYQTPFSHSNSLSFSGGNDNSTYYASLGYSNNENTAKGNSQTSYTGRLNLSSTFWNKLRLNVALSGSHAETSAFASGVDPLVMQLIPIGRLLVIRKMVICFTTITMGEAMIIIF